MTPERPNQEDSAQAVPLPSLCVPSNMQPDLVDKLNFSRITEVYGKLQSDPLGGGRPSVILPSVSKRQAVRHIRAVRDNGVDFNYLLNATCLDNQEFTRQGRKRIEAALKFAVDAGANAVTVSIPMLVEIIKALEPSMKVNISTMVGVDSPEMASYFEGLGADRITLSVTSVNRDFERLAEIRKRVGINLQVIANLECLRGCPFSRYHGNLNAHSSQSNHPSGGFVIDYCYLSCSILRLEDPAHFLMAGWIRPEDQHYYAELGIDSLKLVNRAMDSDTIAFIVDRYTAGRHDGNLYDLFSHPTNNLAYQNKKPWDGLKYMFKPARANLLKLARYKDMFRWERPTIDNRALDGFMEHFVKNRCHVDRCGEGCRYCHNVAARVFEMDPEARNNALSTLKEFKSLLVNGKLFQYSWQDLEELRTGRSAPDSDES